MYEVNERQANVDFTTGFIQPYQSTIELRQIELSLRYRSSGQYTTDTQK